ncbi:uncharacterized protein H6S33_006194 [Morchella sextelata]|uniref:uncharacterized protein n=1 Tax=Morchella sextelata TaxID=1174677 RepID=UPI001D03E2DD|nr:uncharacterized protein H6S33_006194 [Morchella sextelata]KAH0614308.1 hypothetical protein H6S33_006194 [Morchella sextelata]
MVPVPRSQYAPQGWLTADYFKAFMAWAKDTDDARRWGNQDNTQDRDDVSSPGNAYNSGVLDLLFGILK